MVTQNLVYNDPKMYFKLLLDNVLKKPEEVEFYHNNVLKDRPKTQTMFRNVVKDKYHERFNVDFEVESNQ